MSAKCNANNNDNCDQTMDAKQCQYLEKGRKREKPNNFKGACIMTKLIIAKSGEEALEIFENHCRIF
jgi:hypothetical protein